MCRYKRDKDVLDNILRRKKIELKKNILVVGGSGFIGYNLVKKLKYKKKYRIFSISSKKIDKHRIIKGVNYIRCDITKKRN